MSSSQPPADTPVLVVDDHANMLRLLRKVLRHDRRILTAGNGSDAIRVLEREAVAVVLAYLRMPDIDGIELLKACKRLQPNAEYILMTAHASVPTAVEALRLGAAHAGVERESFYRLLRRYRVFPSRGSGSEGGEPGTGDPGDVGS